MAMQSPPTPPSDPAGIVLGPVYSWYRAHGDLVFTSGHTAVDSETGERNPGELIDEAHTALTKLRRTLEAAGSGLEHVLKVTVFLTDMGQYAAFNRVYAKFFPGPDVPARTCVEVNRLPYNFKVEIEAVARIATTED